MEQLTLEQAADNYIYPSNPLLVQPIIKAFKDGANWQKERYKKIIGLAISAAHICNTHGARSIGQLLEKAIEEV